MESFVLTQRRGQLALLARACQRNERASIAPSHAGGEIAVDATMLALEADGLLLSAQDEGGAIGVCGTEVIVHFSAEGQRFRFQTRSCGRQRRTLAGSGAVTVLTLALPLRIDIAKPIERFALRPGDAGLPPAKLRSMHTASIAAPIELETIDERAAVMRLRDPAERPLPTAGEHCWLEQPLGDASEPVAFVVRISEVSPLADGVRRIVARLCGGDDGETLRGGLRALAAATHRPGPVAAAKEGEACLSHWI